RVAEEDALAEGPRTDLELRYIERLHRLVEHDRAGRDLEGALGGDARQLLTRGGGHPGEHRNPRLQLLLRQHPSCRAAPAASLVTHEAGERPDRLRGSDDVIGGGDPPEARGDRRERLLRVEGEL